jgi:hypothetical protein
MAGSSVERIILRKHEFGAEDIFFLSLGELGIMLVGDWGSTIGL